MNNQQNTEHDMTGLVRAQRNELTTATAAEQQRAIAEIQGALTIANRCPRDEAGAMDKILTSCQRIEMAAGAEYEYSRGGTQISGASIKLLEVIAQKWGNIDFGFRELARYPGQNGQAGESTVEAYAWDLESNTRRKVQFTVRHEMTARGKNKVLTDPRDIYEYVANQAQRRVRTCLENVIPRDIIESAREQCRKTLTSKEPVTQEKITALLEAFKQFGVTREHIESRLQRKIATISSAQMLQMRRIFASLRDGIADPSEFFEMNLNQETPRHNPESLDEFTQSLQQQRSHPAQHPESSATADQQPQATQATGPAQTNMFDAPEAAQQTAAEEDPDPRTLLSDEASEVLPHIEAISTQQQADAAEKWINSDACTLGFQDKLLLQKLLTEKIWGNQAGP